MRSGQLKPNVQLEVKSEYVAGMDAFPDRTDRKTLKHFLRHIEQFHVGETRSNLSHITFER